MLEYGKKDTCFKAGNKRIQFARATIKDIERIENLNNEQLKKEFNSIIGLTHVIGCFSVQDLQLEGILAHELADRGFNEFLNNAYIEAKEEQERFEENEGKFLN